jgi:hypothetical protein
MCIYITSSLFSAAILVSLIFRTPLIKRFRQWQVVKDPPWDNFGRHDMKLGASELFKFKSLLNITVPCGNVFKVLVSLLHLRPNRLVYICVRYVSNGTDLCRIIGERSGVKLLAVDYPDWGMSSSSWVSFEFQDITSRSSIHILPLSRSYKYWYC